MGFRYATGRLYKPRAGYKEWWNLDGLITPANCVAAYQFLGSLSAGENLANHGVYNLPSVQWDPYVGSDPYVDYNTGITPANDQTWSMIARFSGATTNDLGIAGSENTLGQGRFYLWARRGAAGDNRLYGNGGFAGVGIRVTDGVMAIAGTNCYYNKVMEGTIDTTWTVGARIISVGAVNIGSGISGYDAVNNFDGSIQAIAIYNTPLTDTQVIDLTDAMNAL